MRRLCLLLLVAILLPRPGQAEENGFLGVALEDVTLPDGGAGVGVGKVYPDTPAATAGLQAGDGFLLFDGRRPGTREDLIKMCMGTKPGTTVSIRLARGGDELEIKVMLGLRPDAAELQRTSLLGRAAPEFSVTPLSGEGAVSSKDFAGKVVVLDFWASWCGPCRAAIPGLNAVYAERQNKDFVLLGITDETAKVAAAVAAEMKYPTATDPTGTAFGLFGVYALPTLIVLDRKGVVRDVHTGAGDPAALGRLIDELLAEKAP
jgi:thiol-disulfide isomerase/thioredoxin